MNKDILKAFYLSYNFRRTPQVYSEYKNIFLTIEEEEIAKKLLTKHQNKKYIYFSDHNYPEVFKTIEFPPPLIFYEGNLSLLNTNIFSIVGSRKIKPYSQFAISDLLTHLSVFDVCTCSGFALGVDKTVHEFSIENNIKTIAVLGCGVNIEYPKKNYLLKNRILEAGGLFLSEFIPDTPPLKHNFPYRNRIISQISKSLFVIQAKEFSGTMTSAKWAMNRNIDIYSLPGEIYNDSYKGNNKLIFDGANPLIDIKHSVAFLEHKFNLKRKIIDQNLLSSHSHELTDYNKSPLKDVVYKIIDILSESPLSFDSMLILLKLKPEELLAILAELEIDRIIKKYPGNYFTLIKR